MTAYSIIIFTWKTRRKSTKNGKITSGSRDGSRTAKCSSMWQHYRNTFVLNNDSFKKKNYTLSTTLRPNNANILSFCIQKNLGLPPSDAMFCEHL